jgi:phosphohistidine phosphatase
MELILWRHADAENAVGGDDFGRALTPRGQGQAARMAARLAPLLDGEWRILCSPALRAVQTVSALDRPHEIRPALGLDASAEGVLREAHWPDGARNALVVGHQPTLGEAAALLLGSAAGAIAFRKGAVWWFALRERDGQRETVLKEVLDPDLLDAGPRRAK